MANFFSRSEIPYSLNPEPPELGILRMMMAMRLFGQQSNPWGMSPLWSGNLQGNPLMPFAGRGMFDPYTGNRYNVPWETAGGGGGTGGGGGSRPPLSVGGTPNRGSKPTTTGNRMAGPGAAMAPPRGGVPMTQPNQTFDGKQMYDAATYLTIPQMKANYVAGGASGGTHDPAFWKSQMDAAFAAGDPRAAAQAQSIWNVATGATPTFGVPSPYDSGAPSDSDVPTGYANPTVPRQDTGVVGPRGAIGPTEGPRIDRGGSPQIIGDRGASNLPPVETPDYDFNNRRDDFWNPDGRMCDGRVPYPNETAPMPDGRACDGDRMYDAATERMRIQAAPRMGPPPTAAPANPTAGGGPDMGGGPAENVGAPMSPWFMPYMGNFTAPMSPWETTGLEGMGNYVTGGMGLGPAQGYLNDVIGGKYIGAANPYMADIESAMAAIKANQDQQALKQLGSRFAAGGNALTGARMTADQNFQNMSDANYQNTIGQMRLNNLTNERALQQGAAGMQGNLSQLMMGGWNNLLNAGALPRNLQQNDLNAQYADWVRQITAMQNQDQNLNNMFINLIRSGPGSHQPGYAPSAAEGWAPIIASLFSGQNGGIGGQVVGGLWDVLKGLFGGGAGGGGGTDTGVIDDYNPWTDYSGGGSPGPWAPPEDSTGGGSGGSGGNTGSGYWDDYYGYDGRPRSSRGPESGIAPITPPQGGAAMPPFVSNAPTAPSQPSFGRTSPSFMPGFEGNGKGFMADGEMYDAAPPQQMNPFMAMILQMLARQQQQGARMSGANARSRQAEAGRPGTPMAAQALAWLNRNYWDPRWVGASNTPGAGANYGFAGFTRGSNPDPKRNPRVGYVGAMKGGAPNPRESGLSTLARMTGDFSDPHRLGFESWMSDFFREMAGPYKEGSNWPLGIPKGAHGPGDDRQYQDAWREFFGRGHSLESMDAALRGEFGGGGGSAGSMWLM